MSNIQDRAARLIALPESGDYFKFTDDRQRDLQNLLSGLFLDEPDTPSPLLALSAPARVDLDEQTNIPVLVASIASGLRSWQVNFTTNLHVFVRDSSSGKLRVAEPLVNMRRGKVPLLSGKGDPPDKLDAISWSAGVNWFDLQAKVPQTYAKGQIAVTAVAHDVRSNSVVMELDSAKSPPDVPLPAPQPYVRPVVDKSPISTAQVALTGALIRISAPIPGNSVRDLASEHPLCSLNVVLIQLDEKPVIIPVTTPAQRRPDADGKQVWRAAFEVDLPAAAETQLAGEYQVYVDLGDELIGPYLFSHIHRSGHQ
ncbi:MAG: hypothetical protein NTY19_04420 [Planctomycetota bacterium]|nr:hypothetical protein [Planctomycetota bacterium]